LLRGDGYSDGAESGGTFAENYLLSPAKNASAETRQRLTGCSPALLDAYQCFN